LSQKATQLFIRQGPPAAKGKQLWAAALISKLINLGGFDSPQLAA
jgi:hypothetical protein